jgi:hypothetical protein
LGVSCKYYVDSTGIIISYRGEAQVFWGEAPPPPPPLPPPPLDKALRENVQPENKSSGSCTGCMHAWSEEMIISYTYHALSQLTLSMTCNAGPENK